MTRWDLLKRKALRFLIVVHTSDYLRSTTATEIGTRWLAFGGLIIGAVVNYCMTR